ncbi:MAG: hypothetical protein ACFFD2_25295 [Promethearchaeota archaeon]
MVQNVPSSRNQFRTLRNFTTSKSLNVNQNGSLILIDSSVSNVNLYTTLLTGNWTIDYNVMSGTGSYGIPTCTVNNSSASITIILDIYGSTKVFINNSAYDWIAPHGSSNITIYNTSIGYIRAYGGDNSASIVNSTVNVMQLYTNGTIYLENTTITNTIYISYDFYQGNIVGYNQTFVGVESANYPKINMGPNVIYDKIFYYYTTHNQVNLTLTNTSQVLDFIAYDSSNISIHSCNMPSVYINIYNDANVTIYYSYINRMRGYNTVNITLFNSTSVRVDLYDSSFVSVINNSHLDFLVLYDSASYYLASDSTIDSIL